MAALTAKQAPRSANNFTCPPPSIFRWKYVLVFEDILGWFLLALFVVVLVNVMVTW
jgi:hypothetical protein